MEQGAVKSCNIICETKDVRSKDINETAVLLMDAICARQRSLMRLPAATRRCRMAAQ